MVQVQVDLERCQGHGRCSLAAPDVFSVDDDGKVVLLCGEITAEQERAVENAVENCPERAIALTK